MHGSLEGIHLPCIILKIMRYTSKLNSAGDDGGPCSPIKHAWRGLLVPPATPAEFFLHMCLQSQLQTAPPTGQLPTPHYAPKYSIVQVDLFLVET